MTVACIHVVTNGKGELYVPGIVTVACIHVVANGKGELYVPGIMTVACIHVVANGKGELKGRAKLWNVFLVALYSYEIKSKAFHRNLMDHVSCDHMTVLKCRIAFFIHIESCYQEFIPDFLKTIPQIRADLG